jgi:ribonuclease Z
MERDAPLEVYGPEGLYALTKHVLAAYQDDIRYRLYGLEPANNQGWRVNTHEIGEGCIFDDGLVQVDAFRVRHGEWPNAYGFRFTTPDKVIVVSGGTAPCDNVLYYGKGADILIHEVYSQRGFDEKPPLWRQYHAEHHTSTRQVAAIARQTRPGLLVLTHTLFWGATEAEILAEVAEGYDGPVVVGHDLQVIE